MAAAPDASNDSETRNVLTAFLRTLEEKAGKRGVLIEPLLHDAIAEDATARFKREIFAGAHLRSTDEQLLRAVVNRDVQVDSVTEQLCD